MATLEAGDPPDPILPEQSPLLIALLAVAVAVVTILTVVHAAKRHRLGWAAAIVFALPLALPAYWVIEVLRGRERSQSGRVHVDPDDEFERPALEWLSREVDRLATALRARGVADEQIRAICHDFFEGLAYGLDSEPVAVSGVPYEVSVVVTNPNGRSVIATDSFAFHEMANSIVDEVLALG